MARLIVFCLGALLAIGAFAANPCTPMPCEPDAASGDAQCAARATWILEGVVLDVVQGEKQVCESLYGCAQVWEGVGVVVSSTRFLKGRVPLSEAGRAILKPGSHCWKYETFIGSEMIGKTFKFFGTDEYLGYWARPGYFFRRSSD